MNEFTDVVTVTFLPFLEKDGEVVVIEDGSDEMRQFCRAIESEAEVVEVEVDQAAGGMFFRIKGEMGEAKRSLAENKEWIISIYKQILLGGAE